MSNLSLEEFEAQCRSMGLHLLKPKGMRKYFILEWQGERLRLARSWELARLRIEEAIERLIGNQQPQLGTEKGTDGGSQA